MRLSLLLVLAVCALFTDQASAQSEFHTAWGRHLGWGSGPGYHSYSQDEIHAWAVACHQPMTGCSNCATFTPQASHDALTPGASAYPLPNGPQLVPPQQYGPAAAPTVTPSPVPAAPSAYHGPALQPQFSVLPQANFVPSHFTNPLIKPTGAAPRHVRPAASAIPRRIPYWVYPANATVAYPESPRRQ